MLDFVAWLVGDPWMCLFLIHQAAVAMLAGVGAISLMRQHGWSSTLEPIAHARYDELPETTEPAEIIDPCPDVDLLMSLPVDELVWVSTEELDAISACDREENEGAA